MNKQEKETKINDLPLMSGSGSRGKIATDDWKYKLVNMYQIDKILGVVAEDLQDLMRYAQVIQIIIEQDKCEEEIVEELKSLVKGLPNKVHTPINNLVSIRQRMDIGIYEKGVVGSWTMDENNKFKFTVGRLVKDSERK